MTETYNVLVVLGPTASGKTHLGVELAQALNGEIISADSRQVYRGLDIGSGKDLDEYAEVPYHLIDVADPGYEFSVFDFQKHFCDAFAQVCDVRKTPIVVGGTALYLDSILSGYAFREVSENAALREQLKTLSLAELVVKLKDLTPQLHNTTDLLDRERLIRAIEIASDSTADILALPVLQPLVLGIDWPREVLKQRITARLKARLDDGLIDEVAALHQAGVSWDTLHFYGLEYRFVAQYLQGLLNRNDMMQKLNSAIHTFSKQQGKWFRRMERKGITIHWLDGEQQPLAQALAVLQDRWPDLAKS